MVLIEDILEVPRDCIVDSVIPKKDVFEVADFEISGFVEFMATE